MIVLFASIACGRSTERETIGLERMREQQRYDVFQASGVFANGASSQHPPPGSVSRESASDTGVTGTGMSNGVVVTTIPVDVTPRLISVGGDRFGVFCAVCHGASGFGGSVVGANMDPPRPPPLRSASIRSLAPGFIYAVATRGYGKMPGYASQLTNVERWAVVAYVQRLQMTPATSPSAIDDSLRALTIARIDSSAAERHRAFGR